MTRFQLRCILIWENIRPDLYSLNGGFPNEAYCIDNLGDAWEVYYSERGSKMGLKKFNDESDACEYLYKLLIRLKRDGYV